MGWRQPQDSPQAVLTSSDDARHIGLTHGRRCSSNSIRPVGFVGWPHSEHVSTPRPYVSTGTNDATSSSPSRAKQPRRSEAKREENA